MSARPREIVRYRAIDVAGRALPSSPEAEAAVLSSILEAKGVIDDVRGAGLVADHFHVDANRRIFEAACDLADTNQPIDVAMVGQWLKQRERLQAVGGVAYLSKLIDATPSIANVLAHARIVLEKARERRLILAGQEIAAAGYTTTDPHFAEWCVEQMQSAAELAGQTDAMRTMGEVGRDRWAQIAEQWQGKREAWGIPLPWVQLDRAMMGLTLGQSTFVAGDTSGGKSIWAEQALLHAVGIEIAREQETMPTAPVRYYHGQPIGGLCLSLEMRNTDMWDRAICAIAAVTTRELATGRDVNGDRISHGKVAAIDAARRTLDASHLLLDDTDKDLPRVRMAIRRAKVKLAKRGAVLRVVVIDHLHIMDYPEGEQGEAALARTVRGLHRCAIEENIAMVILCQFTQSAGRRGEDDQATMDDIRGAAAIKQIATNVLILDNPWVRLKDHDGEKAEKLRRYATIRMNKGRNLGRGSFELFTELEHFRLLNPQL